MPLLKTPSWHSFLFLAIFLLDVKTHIYLWFGWWSEDLDAEANNSRRRRWDEERKKAMESAQSYANGMNLFIIWVFRSIII